MLQITTMSPTRLGRQLRRLTGLGTGGLAIAALIATTLAGAPAALAQPAGAPDSFADLAEQLSPAVVNISTAQNVDRPDRPEPPEGGPPTPDGENPFEDLFRDFFERGQPRGPRRVQSLGSGFVISPEGFVVTNNHVIEDADEITVNFVDGTSLDAVLIGTDPKTDLALLKIENEEPLPFVKFGDSDGIRVGDWVLAIGNPFGLGGSVSAGIISARNRDINAGPYDDFLQTDAAINRGNSGGPLFNMEGDVVGVNTAIISPTGGSIGIGFSVPSNLAQSVVAQLREFGQTRRGWLGVRIQTVNDELAEALGLERPMGALVAEVTEGGPAQDAGVEAGDVIVKFDGEDVEEMRDLPRIVADTPVDSTVRVVIFRKGKTQTLKVKIGLLEEASAGSGPAVAAVPEDSADTEIASFGMTIRAVTDADRTQFSIPDDVDGVLIAAVAPDSAAAEKGMNPGDVIVEVGQEPVTTPDEVVERVEAAEADSNKSVLFLIQSGGDLRFVPLSFPG
ncbi:MAG: DegQ family serine endoprotease [Pseudomonadota bacterium]